MENKNLEEADVNEAGSQKWEVCYEKNGYVCLVMILQGLCGLSGMFHWENK